MLAKSRSPTRTDDEAQPFVVEASYICPVTDEPGRELLGVPRKASAAAAAAVAAERYTRRHDAMP